MCFRRVDGVNSVAKMIIPPNAGTPLKRGAFYVHLGLQIELNFVPRLRQGYGGQAPLAKEENWGARLSFFCALKCT